MTTQPSLSFYVLGLLWVLLATTIAVSIKKADNNYQEESEGPEKPHLPIENEAPDIENEAPDIENRKQNRTKRLMTSNKIRLWPKKISYKFDPALATDEKRAIIAAISVYHYYTCIRFEEDNVYYNIIFVQANGCFSPVGSTMGGQRRQVSCCDMKRCIHELGHVLGLYHEHQHPDVNGWLRIDKDNVQSGWYRKNYLPVEESSVLPSLYDYSSFMHYGLRELAKSSSKPPMTMLFPELELKKSHFYMFKEISKQYECANDCTSSLITCQNDGYMTLVNGQCQCRCPGLDPQTGCTTIITASSNLQWPSGNYTLPKHKDGCPTTDFNEGTLIQTGDGPNSKSTSFSLAGDFVNTKEHHVFCSHNSQSVVGSTQTQFKWPTGSYCVYKKGGSCPSDAGVFEGSVKYRTNSINTKTGELPDGTYTTAETLMSFCCFENGLASDPAIFPTQKPFVLFQKGYSCQQVEGMNVKYETFTVVSSGSSPDKMVNGPYYTSHCSGSITLHYCVYTPVERDCGGVITLNDTNRFATISSPTNLTSLKDCTWLIKGPENEPGTMMLDFDVFNLERDSITKLCTDKIEVRHSRIGQPGLEYDCNWEKYSIQSIFDKLLIRFRNERPGSSSVFSATVRWIPDSSLCYNARDKGRSYDGVVNYTRKFEKCLHWAQALHCNHNPFKHGNYLDRLENNYCRNPDNSFYPWCYTDMNGCQRNYCDVCTFGRPFDTADNCDSIKASGLCSKEMVTKCAATCSFETNEIIYKASNIKCNQPGTISGGSLSSPSKSLYDVGDEVDYICNMNRMMIKRTCLSSGDWTAAKTACVECPLDFEPHDGECYKYINTPLKYTDAVNHCKNIGSTMAKADTSSKVDIFHTLRSNIYPIWLPIKKAVGRPQWEDNSSIRYSSWLRGPPFRNSAKNCFSMNVAKKWTTKQCEFRYNFICKKTFIDDCYLGKRSPSGKCYYLLDKLLSYAKAEEKCNNIGGKVAVVNDKAENDFIWSVSKNNDVFLAGTDKVTEGTFVLSDNSRLPYSNWNTPSMNTVIANCIIMTRNGKWNASKCYHHFTVCESENFNRFMCDDFLANCQSLKDSTPGMCTLYPSFARMYCRVTCNFCVKDCPVLLENPHVELRKRQDLVISTGQKANFKCIDGYYPYSGDMERSCTSNGKLSGNPLICKVHRSDCPSGFTRFKQKCYKFMKQPEEAVDAADKCYDLSATLVTSKTNDENNFIANLRPTNDEIWLGLNSNGGANMRWNDNTRLTWSNWMKGQPIQTSHWLQAIMLASGLWKFTSDTFTRKPFICEKKLVKCPKSFQADETEPYGLCYLLHEKVRSFKVVQESCVESLASLPHPKSSSENNKISLLRNNKEIWLAATDRYSDGNFNWPNGDHVNEIWENWDTGYPKDQPNVDDCTKMDVSKTWSSVPCQGTSLASLCLFHRNACPPGSTLYNNFCYEFVNSQLNVTQSKQACWSKGGDVVQPQDLDENDLIASIRKADVDIWLAASDAHVENNFLGNDGRVIAYENWSPGKPTNSIAKSCVIMLSSGQWSDVSCNLNAYYVCKTKMKDFEEPLKIVGKKGISIYSSSKNNPLSSNVIFITVNEEYKIKHTGYIVSWTYHSIDPQMTYFQVWRMVGKNLFQLIGQNSYRTKPGLQFIAVDYSKQILVNPGDFLGIYTVGGNGITKTYCDSGHAPFVGGLHRSQTITVGIQEGEVKHFMKDSACLFIDFRAAVKEN